MNRSRMSVVVLTVGAVVFSALADGLREDELVIVSDTQDVVVRQSIDLRDCWTVEKTEEIDIPYSAVGWGLTELPEGAMVRLNLWEVQLVGGAFVPDGKSVDLATGLMGKGIFPWLPSGLSRRVYLILHETTREGKVVDAETLAAYFDFTKCKTDDQEFRVAVLDEITHKIDVWDDDEHPWQLVDPTCGHSGVVTDAELQESETTEVQFSFSGAGTFAYEHLLEGGQFKIVIDGHEDASLPIADGWTAQSVAISGDGEHEISFVYTASGDRSVAGLRHVSWRNTPVCERAICRCTGVRVDLREGVRMPESSKHILPFEYSSTNWIGDVAGVSDASSARVSVVELDGSDPDVTKWTGVPGTLRVLKEAAGEGEVMWHGKRGVWKAIFEIVEDSDAVYTETAYFDLRNSKLDGFMILLK